MEALVLRRQELISLVNQARDSLSSATAELEVASAAHAVETEANANEARRHSAVSSNYKSPS